jgi:hypothetical protein
MSNAKMQKADYPEERPDWLMIEEYAKRKSIFGCILCDKTHKSKDCEHKAKRIAKTWYEAEKEQYSYYGD